MDGFDDVLFALCGADFYYFECVDSVVETGADFVYLCKASGADFAEVFEVLLEVLSN